MFTIIPIGIVKNSRSQVEDDNWGGIISEKDFQPQGEIRQPEWASEWMKNYWINPGII